VRPQHEESEEKLRGGFYTPKNLVEVCFRRIEDLSQGRTNLAALEPSAGDGAFIRALSASPTLKSSIREVTAIEPLGSEAEKVRESLEQGGMNGKVLTMSAIDWARNGAEPVDLAFGNPPFLRYQHISPSDRESISELAKVLDLTFQGVSNLWIPLMVGSLNKVRIGGTFAFVLPSETLTGLSAKVFRDWLLKNTEQLTIDLFPPGSFPNVLQEITVLSGNRCEGSNPSSKVRFYDHADERTWVHAISEGQQSWTRYLLSPEEVEALEYVEKLTGVARLGQVATLEVSNVTGANNYFCISEETRKEWGLVDTRPLLARVRDASGLVYDQAQADENRERGLQSWLLDFSLSDSPQELSESPYVKYGEAMALDQRYKCRIRDPWYVLPPLKSGRLLLSKRSHLGPRLLLNSVGAFTTDTIYCGNLRPDSVLTSKDLVAGFQNSLTTLSAEIEGRSFGGGVLELVPSEVSRLLLPNLEGFGKHLSHLNSFAKRDQENLVERVDELIADNSSIDPVLWDTLRAARGHLTSIRLNRNGSRASFAIQG